MHAYHRPIEVPPLAFYAEGAKWLERSPCEVITHEENRPNENEPGAQANVGDTADLRLAGAKPPKRPQI